MVSPEPERVFESAETERGYFLFLVQCSGPFVLIADAPHMPEFCTPFFQPLCTGFPRHEDCSHL
jgi:hypothetical protein